MRKNNYKYILKVLTLSFSAVGLELSGSGLTYANDAPPVQSETVELPDQLNTISGALANDADVKHYIFTAIRGQRIIINPTNYSPSRWPWLIEYKIGDTWQTKWGAGAYLSPYLAVGQKVELRISKAPNTVIESGARFEVLFGSAPRVATHAVTGDSNEFNVKFGKHLSSRTINWHAKIEDYKGHPLQGVPVVLELNADQDSGSNHLISSGTSNLSGMTWRTVTLPECQGRLRTEPFWIWQNGARHKWTLTYNTGYWFMYPSGNEEGGVGSKTGEKVSFVQLCTKRITG